MFPISTERLTIRMLQASDLRTLVAYRNDPAVARLQSWELPFTDDAANELVAAHEGLDGPIEGAWVQMAIDRGDQMVGDVAVHLAAGGGVAEIGFTLAGEHHGNGYAREAAGAVVDLLVTKCGVQRIEASLDPGNINSMRVLEAIGLKYECLARSAYHWRGEWVDDLRYAMTAADRSEWVARDRTPPSKLELVEIQPEEAYLWGRLRTHYSQENFVSPMALSFRDALFPEPADGAPVVPWMRGILADDVRVGFLMTAAVTEHHREPYLWRLLIDRLHQRRGIGERAVGLLIDQLRTEGHSSLKTSYVDEVPGCPAPFYRRLGFVPTGEIDDGEVVTRLRW